MLLRKTGSFIQNCSVPCILTFVIGYHRHIFVSGYLLEHWLELFGKHSMICFIFFIHILKIKVDLSCNIVNTLNEQVSKGIFNYTARINMEKVIISVQVWMTLLYIF